MRLSTQAIAACALLSFSPLSSAAVYLGATGTMSEFSKYDDVKRGFGSQVFAGYKGETVPLMFELAYLTTGDNDIEGMDVSLSFTGQAASVGYYGKMNDNGSGFFAKVGYYTGDSKLKAGGGGGSVKETSSGATYAFGIDWMVARNFGFRFDVGGLLNVKDLPGLDSTHKSNVTLINLGVVFSFGGSEPAPRYQPAPVYTPAVAAPQQVYAPEAVPVVAPVAAPQAPQTQFVAGSQAVVIAGGTVRGQPSSQSSVTTTLPNGQAVRLDSQRIDNAEGSWWLVSGERIKGWVNDKDLQH